ncbi:hypothetical protein MMC17_005537 [Xylographa soralifera]|nr:hypothetical protein [Xylographa soralifera]
MSLASLTYPFLFVKSKISSDASPARLVPPPLAGLHRLTFPVSNLDVSLAWYSSVMSASHLLALDQYTSTGQRRAAQLAMPALVPACLELRLDHEEAKHARGSEPVTWAVKSRGELQAWIEWLDVRGVKRSKILAGAVGWLLVFEDPDGRFLRLHTQEAHEGTTEVDRDDYWLGGGRS